MTAGFTVERHGHSLALLTPLDEAAQEWCDEHLPSGEDVTMWGAAYVIEPRYMEAILDGIAEAGLAVAGLN